MTVCCTEGTASLFSRSARRYASRYRRRGLDRAQRSLLYGLANQGIDGLSVLEIGGGVGGLHIELLQRGATKAFAVDTAPGMIEEGRRLASDLGLAEKIAHRVGDFVSLAEDMEEADVVVMDKVLCCYPEPALLIRTSASKAKRLYAVSYPRQSLLARVVFRVPFLLGSIFRWSFYPFYHDPQALDASIQAEGFREVYAVTTLLWQIAVFSRPV